MAARRRRSAARFHDVLHIGSLVLRHHPTEALAPGEIAGHLHPCAKVTGRGRQRAPPLLRN